MTWLLCSALLRLTLLCNSHDCAPPAVLCILFPHFGNQQLLFPLISTTRVIYRSSAICGAAGPVRWVWDAWALSVGFQVLVTCRGGWPIVRRRVQIKCTQTCISGELYSAIENIKTSEATEQSFNAHWSKGIILVLEPVHADSCTLSMSVRSDITCRNRACTFSSRDLFRVPDYTGISSLQLLVWRH